MTVEQHLDEGTVQRLLHDELSDSRAPEIRAHVERCVDCRSFVAEARREEAELFNRFEALDDPVPQRRWDQIVDQSQGRSAARREPGARRTAWRWAAGALLAIGLSGVAYAAPGSPLRWVVARLADLIRPSISSRRPDAPVATAPVGGGVMMDPGGSSVIEILSSQPFDTLRVMIGGGAQIEVRATGGSVTFASDVDRLSISNSAGAASIEVVIPRTARRVEIVARGRRLYLKEGTAITSLATDTTGGRHVIIPSNR